MFLLQGLCKVTYYEDYEQGDCKDYYKVTELFNAIRLCSSDSYITRGT